MQALLDRYRTAQEIPGVSAVVIRDHRVIFSGGSGVADIETQKPATDKSIYYIGSVTKVLTATLTLHLAERQVLDLADSVTGIASGNNAADTKITVRQLLTHSSGLEREGNFNYWFTGVFPDRESLRDYLSGTDLRSKPGAQLHYSNIGFAALGLFLEQATGQGFSEALATRILNPLGMADTGVPGPVADVATGYTPIGRVIPSEARPFAGVGRPIGARHERMYHDANAMSPAFGAYSTAGDLGRLALFLLGDGGGDILSASGRADMRARQRLGRGLGIGLTRKNGKLIMSHGGWFAAHRSQVLIDPDNGVAVVVLANSDDAAPGKLADALYSAALAGD